MCPNTHVRRRDPEPAQHLADAAQAAAAQRRARQVAVDRPEPERVERARPPRRSRVPSAAARSGWRAAPLARERDPRARRRAGAGADRGVVGALRELVQERVDRRERRLVVVGPRALLRQPHDPARHRAGGEPLERRHRRVQVDVVAVQRVDVVAQPDAGVGEPQPRGRGELGEPLRERARLGRVDRLGQAEEAGALGLQPRVDPAGDEPVVVVAGEHQQLAAGAERRAGLGEERRRELGGVAVRRLAQLEPVAEDHEPVDPVERLDQRRAQLGAPQQVLAARRADVQVGDDERPHPTSVPRRWPRSTASSSPTSRACSRDRSRRCCSATSAPTWSRSSGPTAATTRARGGRRGAATKRPTTSGSTATSARSRSTSAIPATSSSRAGSPAARTC